jgi:hypothetical protein
MSIKKTKKLTNRSKFVFFQKLLLKFNVHLIQADFWVAKRLTLDLNIVYDGLYKKKIQLKKSFLLCKRT